MTSPPGSIGGGSNRHCSGVLLYRGDMNASDSDDPALTPESFLPGSLMSTFRERAVVHDRENTRSEEHTSELQSRGHLVCRLLLEKKNERLHALRLLLTLTDTP